MGNDQDAAGTVEPLKIKISSTAYLVKYFVSPSVQFLKIFVMLSMPTKYITSSLHQFYLRNVFMFGTEAANKNSLIVNVTETERVRIHY